MTDASERRSLFIRVADHDGEQSQKGASSPRADPEYVKRAWNSLGMDAFLTKAPADDRVNLVLDHLKLAAETLAKLNDKELGLLRSAVGESLSEKELRVVLSVLRPLFRSLDRIRAIREDFCRHAANKPFKGAKTDAEVGGRSALGDVGHADSRLQSSSSDDDLSEPSTEEQARSGGGDATASEIDAASLRFIRDLIASARTVGT